MKNSHKFFSNRDCKYFPCHDYPAEGEFNCLFCYCPLYFLPNCGGGFSLLKNGVKDCTGCPVPHGPGGWEHINAVLEGYFESIKREAP